jgi:hypothetical protein
MLSRQQVPKIAAWYSREKRRLLTFVFTIFWEGFRKNKPVTFILFSWPQDDADESEDREITVTKAGDETEYPDR